MNTTVKAPPRASGHPYSRAHESLQQAYEHAESALVYAEGAQRMAVAGENADRALRIAASLGQEVAAMLDSQNFDPTIAQNKIYDVSSIWTSVQVLVAPAKDGMADALGKAIHAAGLAANILDGMDAPPAQELSESAVVTAVPGIAPPDQLDAESALEDRLQFAEFTAEMLQAAFGSDSPFSPRRSAPGWREMVEQVAQDLQAAERMAVDLDISCVDISHVRSLAEHLLALSKEDLGRGETGFNAGDEWVSMSYWMVQKKARAAYEGLSGAAA